MQHRSLLRVFVLNVITLGFYFLYWLVVTRRDMLKLGVKNVPSIWILVAPVLSLMAVFLIYFLAMSLTGSSTTNVKLDTTLSNHSPAETVLKTTVFLASSAAVIAMFVVPFFWVWRYSAGVTQVTHGHLSRDYSFWLWVVLALLGANFIWQLIIQNGFNNTGGAASGSG